MSDTGYRLSVVVGLALLAVGLIYSHYKTNENTNKALCASHVMSACKALGK